MKTITVTSSPNSLPFYEKPGFEVIEEEKNEKGMRSIPVGNIIID